MVMLEMVTWLASDGLGTAATNLFYGDLPDSPDSLVCLQEYGGLPNALVLGGTTVQSEFPRFQALTRGERDEYDAPRLKLQQVMASFTKIGDGVVLLGVQYHAVRCIIAPTKLMRDENFRYCFVASFEVDKGFSPS